MENRNTILVDFQVEPADGYAERRAAVAMVDEPLAGRRRITLGGDKGYDTRDFIAACRTLTGHSARGPQPGARRWLGAGRSHSAPSGLRKQSVDSQARRRGLRLDEDHRRSARTRYRGCERVQMQAYLVAAAYNLIRISKLGPALV
jgi:IS5 family transposase